MSQAIHNKEMAAVEWPGCLDTSRQQRRLSRDTPPLRQIALWLAPRHHLRNEAQQDLGVPNARPGTRILEKRLLPLEAPETRVERPQPMHQIPLVLRLHQFHRLSNQFSNDKPGMREKCFVLPVTRVTPASRAVAAMSKSASGNNSPVF